MEIRNIMIDWMEGYANDPEIKVLVDEIPKDFIYEKRGSLYFAEKEGCVRFFYYERPDRGYGGTKFELKMEDGSTVILKGPWSSNSMTMNGAGFNPSIEVAMTEEVEVFKRGYTFYAGAMTVEKVREGFKKFLPSVELRPVTKDGEPCYEVRKDNLNKEELKEQGYLKTGYAAMKKKSRIEMGSGEGVVRKAMKRR